MPRTPILDLIRGNEKPADWFLNHVWHEAGLLQSLAFAGSLLLAYWGTRWLQNKLQARNGQKKGMREWTCRRLPAVVYPLLTLFIMILVRAVSRENGWPEVVTDVCVKFTEAWLVIQIFAAMLLPPGWTRAVSVVVGGLFLLEMMGLLDHLIGYMDSLALTFKDQRVSVLEMVQAMLLLAVILPLINRLCQFIEEAMERFGEINGRVKVLVAKLTKVGLYTIAIVFALNMVGIDLQMLTVFSGAVGLGLGFGLQKVVSNLVSGVILLLDNSIKPGDVIEVGGAYGWVESMNARFASMVTRDGKALLIPNDELISNQVVNWTFTGPNVRAKIPVGVAYSTDLGKAMELMLKACEGMDRILENPGPRVLLKGFGDSCVNLELRVWVQHPQRGMANVASEIQMAIWESFKEHGIEFPFPQRDVHVKAPVTVRLEEGKKGDGE